MLATVATLFGVATSLGLGGHQVNAGLNQLFEIRISASAFVNEILGVESDAGISIQTQQAIDQYGLKSFELAEGREQELRQRVDQALRNEVWVVLTGWDSHWMSRRWSLRFLEYPKASLQ